MTHNTNPAAAAAMLIRELAEDALTFVDMVKTVHDNPQVQAPDKTILSGILNGYEAMRRYCSPMLAATEVVEICPLLTGLAIETLIVNAHRFDPALFYSDCQQDF